MHATTFCRYLHKVIYRTESMGKIIQLLLIVLFTCVIAGGCSKSDQQKQLDSIEQLLNSQKNEEAAIALDDMNPEELIDDESVALYWFFKTQADFRQYKKVLSLEPLKKSTAFFEKQHDEEKMTWAYYYLGCLSEDAGDITNAIIYLKKAERYALSNKSQMTRALHYIYQAISGVNHDGKEFQLALFNGKLALNYALKLNDSIIIATDLMNLAASYNALDNMDSAHYFINRMLPYLPAVPERQRTNHYCNIGLIYKDQNNELAKEYLQKSVEVKHNAYAYRALAQIYQKEGNKEKANEMWHKALETKNLSLKANVVKGMAKAKTEEGDYKAAHELDLWAAALKDSLHRQQKEENIKGQQELFEKELANEQLREKHRRAAWVIAVLLLSVAILAIWTVRKKRNNRRRMAAMSEELEQKARAMEQLQQENESNKKQLDRLSRDMTGFEQKHEQLLAEGQRLYESITVNGGNTVKWTKDDFAHFVLYYKLGHPDFVQHVENDYDELTPRQKTFLILYDMGMTDEDVMRTLVLTESSVRANKTRIKGKEVGERQQS